MSKIKILDDITINKISAGEVIDRPSSIVKELIENSIDANSKKITIEIKGGGIKYIRVSDNGDGISSEDVEIAFFRHATSKINSYHDLSNIYTMGFRGEALSSIASISKINLFTKSKEEILGTHAEFAGDKLIKKESMGCPSGTTIIVEDVFYNIPARYKFLKKESVETKYIIDVVTREALINADISFEFINNGNMLFKTSGKNNLEENIYDILGYGLRNNLIPIQFTYEDASINGFITNINYYVKNHKNIFLYINKRCVVDETFKKTIMEAYKSLLTLHQYPVIIFNISIPPDRIDVNVHPSKLFIKLYEKERLYDYICKVIKNKLLNNQESKIPILKDISNMDKINDKKNLNSVNEKSTVYNKPVAYQYKFDKNFETSNQSFKTNSPYIDNIDSYYIIHNDKIKPNYKIIGQIFNTYIILESSKELYIVDQHAAHERVLYEKYSNEYFSKHIETQVLLIPEIIPLKPNDYVFIKEIEKNLENLGFNIDTLGDNVLIIRAVPSILDRVNSKDLIMDLIEDMEQTKIDLHDIEQLNKAIIKSACKSAVKAYKKLETIEIDNLILELIKCKEPFTCPHGRPTIIKRSISDIEKLFKRR